MAARPDDYWHGDDWKADLFRALFREYEGRRFRLSQESSRRQTGIRWEIAEAWIAAAAVSLSYWKDKGQTYQDVRFEVAELLRKLADEVEANGLRELPFRRFGDTDPE